MRDFPTDETTLTLLEASCKINPDTGQSHLHDFLAMGERIKSSTLIDDSGGIPIYDVEFEEGYESYNEHSVILALIAEIDRLRSTISRKEIK